MSFNPGGGGGSSSIAGSTDVALSSVANSQVLTYDNAMSKWKNAASATTIAGVSGLQGALDMRIPAVILEESEAADPATHLAGYPVPTVVYIIPDGARTW